MLVIVLTGAEFEMKFGRSKHVGFLRLSIAFKQMSHRREV